MATKKAPAKSKAGTAVKKPKPKTGTNPPKKGVAKKAVKPGGPKLPPPRK